MHVRIFAVVLPLLLTSTGNAFGQTRIALTGGLDYATWHQSWPGDESTNGFSAGVSAIHSLFGAVEFELRSVYSRRGQSSSFEHWPSPPPAGPIRGVDQVSEKHLGLVALGRVNLPVAARGLRAYLAAGPALSWESSCHDRRTIQESPVSWLEPGTRTWECEGRDRLDFGLAGGLGLELRVAGSMGVTFGTLYTHGFRNLAKALDERNGDTTKLRAVTIRTGLVYRIW